MTKSELFDFSNFPVLTTARLVLRRVQPEDASDILVFRGDWDVQKYNGPVFKDAAEVQTLIDELDQEYAAQTGVSWGVTQAGDDAVLGLFSIHHWDKFHRRAEVGYDLARAHWGQGIASETLRAIIQFGFDRLDLNRIYANTIADNHESVRLLERLGFEREGTRRKHSWEDDGTFHDSAIYGLLRHEYSG